MQSLHQRVLIFPGDLCQSNSEALSTLSSEVISRCRVLTVDASTNDAATVMVVCAHPQPVGWISGDHPWHTVPSTEGVGSLCCWVLQPGNRTQSSSDDC